MLQATSYTSDEAPLAFDGDVRFVTASGDRPLPQPPSTFKHGCPQQSLARHMDAISAGSLGHAPTLNHHPAPHSTANTASESASHQLPNGGPRQTTDRELRPSAILIPTPALNDAQPASVPAPESPAKKSHSRKQPRRPHPAPVERVHPLLRDKAHDLVLRRAVRREIHWVHARHFSLIQRSAAIPLTPQTCTALIRYAAHIKSPVFRLAAATAEVSAS
jgi:hypothetical protein